MMYFLYKTTNLVNGKYYIGVHKGDVVDESYLGSGRLITLAIKKYGKNNFKREILKTFNTVEEMFAEECKTVNQDVVDDENSYNLCIGGRGGIFKSPEHVERMRAVNKYYSNTPKGKSVRSTNMKKLNNKNWARTEYRKEMSKLVNEQNKKMWKNKEFIKNQREKQSQNKKMLWKSPEYRKKTLEGRKNTWASKAYKENMSKKVAAAWTPERRKKQAEVARRVAEKRKLKIDESTQNISATKIRTELGV